MKAGIPPHSAWGFFFGLEVVGISKKVSKRHRRRQQIQVHLARPDPGPPLVRPKVREPFYLHELGLTRECSGDCPAWGELPPVIRRGRP